MTGFKRIAAVGFVVGGMFIGVGFDHLGEHALWAMAITIGCIILLLACVAECDGQ